MTCLLKALPFVNWGLQVRQFIKTDWSCVKASRVIVGQHAGLLKFVWLLVAKLVVGSSSRLDHGHLVVVEDRVVIVRRRALLRLLVHDRPLIAAQLFVVLTLLAFLLRLLLPSCRVKYSLARLRKHLAFYHLLVRLLQLELDYLNFKGLTYR